MNEWAAGNKSHSEPTTTTANIFLISPGCFLIRERVTSDPHAILVEMGYGVSKKTPMPPKWPEEGGRPRGKLRGDH